MKKETQGKTHEQRPLELFLFGDVERKKADCFVFAGVHGDEVEAVEIGQRFLKWCEDHEDELRKSHRKIMVMPQANPDGIAHCSRTNANGVDLNRNMDTKDWDPVPASERYHPGPSPLSEPESRALKVWVEKFQPDLIVSLHTYTPQINVNGPAEEWGKIFSKLTGYPVSLDIGYPTPGSFGTWAGHERRIPTITFEIRRDLNPDDVDWERCLSALVAAARGPLKT